MRASLDTGLWTNFNSSYLNPEGKAILRYSGRQKEEPNSVSKTTAIEMLDPFKLLPYDKSLVAPDPDTDFRVMFVIVADEKNFSRAYVELGTIFIY
jgi:hypothetical protein